MAMRQRAVTAVNVIRGSGPRVGGDAVAHEGDAFSRRLIDQDADLAEFVEVGRGEAQPGVAVGENRVGHQHFQPHFPSRRDAALDGVNHLHHAGAIFQGGDVARVTRLARADESEHLDHSRVEDFAAAGSPRHQAQLAGAIQSGPHFQHAAGAAG